MIIKMPVPKGTSLQNIHNFCVINDCEYEIETHKIIIGEVKI